MTGSTKYSGPEQVKLPGKRLVRSKSIEFVRPTTSLSSLARTDGQPPSRRICRGPLAPQQQQRRRY